MLDDTFHGILRDVYHAVQHTDRTVTQAIRMTTKPSELSDDQWNTFVEKISSEVQKMIDESVRTVFFRCVQETIHSEL